MFFAVESDTGMVDSVVFCRLLRFSRLVRLFELVFWFDGEVVVLVLAGEELFRLVIGVA